MYRFIFKKEHQYTDKELYLLADNMKERIENNEGMFNMSDIYDFLSIEGYNPLYYMNAIKGKPYLYQILDEIKLKYSKEVMK